MADNEPQQTFIENDDLILADDMTNVELPSNENGKRLNDIASSDILQRALDEAGGYGQTLHSHSSNLERINDNIKHLTDHSYIHPCTPTINSPLDNFNSPQENTSAEKNKQSDLQGLQFSNVSDINNSQEMNSSLILKSQNEISINDSGMGRLNIVEDADTVVNNIMSNESVTVTETDVFSSNSYSMLSNTNHQTAVSVAKQNILSSLITTSSSPSSSQSSSNVIDLKFVIRQSDAPIGSVENPMQIIHNGTNQYHSTQVLTPAQLQQIKLVLQREHAKKLANGKASLLFDPNTRTKLLCRIVHPSELKSKAAEQEVAPRQTAQVSAVGRGRGRPKKFSGRRLEDEEKGNSSLSKEERDEKKKHRPRTRSGRISKPPSYMVKDYKRIHHLDFNEDGNESDGGYSDYHVSDEEKDGKGSKSSNLPPGVTTAKQRSYSCISCNKAYIGRGGLSRHYRLNPNHGSMPEGNDDISTQDETSNSSFASSILSSSGGNTNSQNNIFSPTNSFKPEAEPPPPPIVQQPLRSVNVRDPISEERRVRLKEILKTYSTTELVDIVLPTFAQDVSMWKFFTAKCQKPSEGLSIFEMLKEFEKFLMQMQRISLTCLTQATAADQGKTIINISSRQIAEALSLERGSFAVKDDGTVSANLKMMELANIASIPNMNPSTTDTIFHPYLKRKRNDLNEVDVNAGLPDQILSDAHENSSLDLPLAEETLPESTNINQPQADLLSSCMDKIDSQNEMLQKNLFDLNSSTTVTPSSLSSGCLSAVNSSQLQKGYMFTALNDAQHYQNMQLKKVRLLETVLQNQLSPKMTSESSTSSINGFPLTTDCNLGDLVTSASSPIVQNHDCNNAIVNQVFSLASATDILTTCPEYSPVNSQPSTVQSASFINSLHTPLSEDSHKVSTSSENFTNCLNVTPMENPNASINNSEVQTCMQSDVPPSSSDIVTQAYQVPTSDIVTDAIKEPPVLRQLMLPDGQLINVWSNPLNSDKSSLEQVLRGYLPGNFIVLQNTDGSVQVPQTQGSTLETLQALVTSDSSAEQAGSLVHDS